MGTSTTQELRIFISSTFRDLQEEREHLVKKIFPEIRALCRKRGVAFTEIDLRWGITTEEAEQEGIIRICLDEIDRCRPYFIGILGERYGWVPPTEDARRHLERYALHEGHLDAGASITEMEIVHGVLANPHMTGRAFFYFRHPDATPVGGIDSEPVLATRLQRLKQRIRSGGHAVREDFSSATELGDWIQQDLLQLLDAEYPIAEAPDDLELERRAHAAFAASRMRAYIPNPQYLQQFNEWEKGIGDRDWGVGKDQEHSSFTSSLVQHSTLSTQHSLAPSLTPNPSSLTPLIISGASGLGKSSLVARLVDAYRSEHPTSLVIQHYVGASESGGSATAVMRHVIEEIRRFFGIDEPTPRSPRELQRSFPNWLFRADSAARLAGIEVLIALDALNQLDDAGRRLAWLPSTVPPTIKLLVSTTPGEAEERLRERNWETLAVTPVASEDQRHRIVAQYLGEFNKRVTEAQLRRITSAVNASSPLFLRLVAEELRLHGEHETLDEVIDRYSSTSDLLEAFDRLLQRMESDYGAVTMSKLLQAIWVSRAGLSESELLAISGINRLELSRLLFAFDFHLLTRDGLLGFFHDYLRRAVERRYLGSDQLQQRARASVAEHFEHVALTRRAAWELLWQYAHAADDSNQARHLSRPEVLMTITDSTEGEQAVLEQWARLIENGRDMVAAFKAGLESVDANLPVAERAVAMRVMATLLMLLHRFDAAQTLSRELIALGEQEGDLLWQLEGHRRCGVICMDLGEYEQALVHHETEERLARELGDHVRMHQVLGNLGLIYTDQGRYAEAADVLQRMLAAGEEQDHRDLISGALLNLGNVYSEQGLSDIAMECYQRYMTMAQEDGDRDGMGDVLNQIGLIHLRHGRLVEAREFFGRKLAISEELGDRLGILNALGNTGSVLNAEGKFEEAIEYFTRSQALSEELGNRIGVGYSLGSIGASYLLLHKMPEALEHLNRGLEIHRAIGHPSGCSMWLLNFSIVFVDAVSEESEFPTYLDDWVVIRPDESWRDAVLRTAVEYLDELASITEGMGDGQTIANSRLCRARVEAARGDLEAARRQLFAVLDGANDESRRAEALYWLWKLNVGEDEAAGERYRDEALGAYRAMYEMSPNEETKMRIEELAGTDSSDT